MMKEDTKKKVQFLFMESRVLIHNLIYINAKM
jgi:hypothetical protein